MLRALGLVAASIMLAVVFVSAALAQTLTDPNPRTKFSSPQVAAKSRPTGRMKSCSLFGAGFVSVPGTDACVKIGGYVTVEGTANKVDDFPRKEPTATLRLQQKRPGP
jgi:hypothetical protein